MKHRPQCISPALMLETLCDTVASSMNGTGQSAITGHHGHSHNMTRVRLMHVTRLYSGDDGESHFEDLEIEVGGDAEIGRLSVCIPTTGLVFRETTADYNYGWHNAPQRQYILMLDGSVDITVGSGETRRLNTGDILLCEDTTGRGHVSQAVDGQPRRSVFVTLE